jgi:hypothetical protein
MGAVIEQFNRAFRDFNTDGVAASGLAEVDKADARAIGPIIEQAVAKVGLGALISARFATLAAANANLAYPDGAVAIVYADPTTSNNDLAVKVGASGTGNWAPSGIIAGIITGAAQGFLSRSANTVPFATRAALIAATGMVAGDRARVRTSDTGTHAAISGEVALGGSPAIVGAQIPNAGDYTYTTSWLRSGDLDSQTASAAATLAGHYANDASDADVPGGAAGERGAKYWAQVAFSAIASALTSFGIFKKAGYARFALFYASDRSIWFDLTPTTLKHIVIDNLIASVTALQASFASFAAAGQKLVTKVGSAEFSLYFIGDKTRWFRMTPTSMQHPVIDNLVSTVATLSGNNTKSTYTVRDTKWDNIQLISETPHFEGMARAKCRAIPARFTAHLRPILRTCFPAASARMICPLTQRPSTQACSRCRNAMC